MASVFKPSGRNVYRIEFRDQHGEIRVISSGLKDKRLAQSKADKLEEDADRLRAGKELKYAEVTAAILLGDQGALRRPWKEVTDAYVAELIRRGSDPKGLTVSEARRILALIAEGCQWERLADVRGDTFTSYLGKMAEAGRAPRTQNRHHETLRAFLNWCVQQDWLTESPIAKLRMAPVGQKGRRRRRRAFTPFEWRRLMETTPLKRRSVYRVAAFSGFRRSEMKKLEKQDCTPVGPRPRWHVRPEVTKNGQGVDLPMQPECAAALAPIWEAAKDPGSRLFVAQRNGQQDSYAVPLTPTVRADLKRAGIARQDGRGRWADFHSCRYTFCTWLSRRHPIQVVQRLMRHSTIKLTSDLYTDLGLEDLGADAWVLPPIETGEAPAAPEATDQGDGEERVA
jgi:integrase